MIKRPMCALRATFLAGILVLWRTLKRSISALILLSHIF